MPAHKKDNPANRYVGVRFTQDEKAAIEAAAARRGLTLTEFVRNAIKYAMKERN